MMKKMICTLLFLALTLGTFSSVSASSKATNIYVNGSESRYDSLAIHGRTVVTIRAFTDLGISYLWDNESKTAVLTKKGLTDDLKLTVDQKIAIKNDKKIVLDVPITLINGRIMVPLKFIAEAFDVEVEYVKETNTAYISTSEYRANIETLKTANLVDARLAVISIPGNLAKGVQHLDTKTETGGYELLYFPYGKAMEYYSVWADVITYTKVNDRGIAEILWIGRGNIETDWSEESGKKPPVTDMVRLLIHNNHNTQYGEYGVFNLNGEYTNYGSIKSVDSMKDLILIHKIPNEERTD